MARARARLDPHPAARDLEPLAHAIARRARLRRHDGAVLAEELAAILDRVAERLDEERLSRRAAVVDDPGDLALELGFDRDDEAAVARHHGLVGAWIEIDDGQPPMAERHRPVPPDDHARDAGSKRPLTEHGFTDASRDLATIARWWKRCCAKRLPPPSPLE